jgi:hypothetical protein
MTNLVDQLKAERLAEKVQAVESYLQLVRRADKPRKGDACELNRICHLLLIPVERFEADVRALDLAAELETVAAGENEASMEASRIAAEIEQLKREHQRATRDAEDRLEELNNDLGSHEERREKARAAKRNLAQMKGAFWRIFSRPKPPDTAIEESGYHRQAIDAWLADCPLAVEWPHEGRREVTDALKELGYVPTRPNVWELGSANNEPKATKAKAKGTKDGSTRKAAEAITSPS